MHAMGAEDVFCTMSTAAPSTTVALDLLLWDDAAFFLAKDSGETLYFALHLIYELDSGSVF